MAIGFPVPSSAIGTLLHTMDESIHSNARYGEAVGIGPNYVVVGAYGFDNTAPDTGRAYVYDIASGNLVYTLENPSAYSSGDYDNFGNAVDTSLTYTVVGAYSEDDAVVSNAGKAYIFSNATGNLLHTLNNPNSTANNQPIFGCDVAINDTYTVVGAYFYDGSQTREGIAYIFNSATGALVRTLNCPSPSFDARFGWRVGLSDTHVIVGCQTRENAYIFDVTNGNLVHTLSNPNPYTGTGIDYFGRQVDISDTYAIVSAWQEDDAGGNESGKAYIFDVTSGNLLHTLDNPNDYDTSASDNFGRSVSITENYAIVGAPLEDSATGGASGVTYIFNTSDGSLQETVRGSGQASALFGYGVAAYGDNLVVGAYQDGANQGGKAYVYSIASGGGGGTFTFNNRDYIYNSTKSAWEVNSPITVAQSGSPVSDLSELADSTSILNDPANEVLTYADLNAILAVTNPATGQLAFNLDTSDMYIFGGTNWQKVYDEDDVPVPVILAWGGSRAFSMGGEDTARSDTIEYFDMSTSGNSYDFGNLTQARNNGATASNGTRALYASGGISAGPTNVIDYITCATLGDAIDFGDVTGDNGVEYGRTGLTGVSDGTYGIFMGGQIQSGYGSNVIDRVTIATTGNATDIGDLTQAIVRYASSTNDDTRGVNIGGYNQNSYINVMDYITMANTGNATDFGDPLQGLAYGSRGVVGDNTIGVFGGGYHDTNFVHQDVLQQITIQTTANATSFGNLSAAAINMGATTNGTIGVFFGLQRTSGYVVDIEQITLGTPGTATDFGDLGVAKGTASGVSGAAA